MEFLNNFLNILLYPVRLIIVMSVLVYKKVISPVLPNSCKFSPSCSGYMLLAIKKHGLMRGFLMGFKRVLRCTPKAQGGLDPVPENIKGDAKWIV